MSTTTTAPRTTLSRAVSQRVKPLGVLLAPSSHTPTPPRTEDPTDAAPIEGPPPSESLHKRLEELRNILKSLHQYFEGVANSHVAQARALYAIASPGVIQTHFTGAELFLPAVASEDRPQDVGWASLLTHIQRDGSVEAAEHVKYANVLTEKIVPVLVRLRAEAQVQVAALDTEVHSILAAVSRLRSTYTISLAQLTKALAVSTESPSSVDPFIVRASVEQHALAKVTKENELLSVTLKWQDRVKEFEVGAFDLINLCLKKWAEAKKSRLVASLEACSATEIKATMLAPDAEWKYFETLHQLLPASTAEADVTTLDYPGRNDSAIVPTKSGFLERKKRFVQNWKRAYFVLTPSGHLHEYSSPEGPLDRPHISLFLPNCTIGPILEHELLQGETVTSPKSPATESVRSPAEAIKAAAESRDAPVEVPSFKFIIEGRRIINGSIGVGHSELARVLRATTREDLQGWWDEISKFTKAPGTSAPIKIFKRNPSALIEPEAPAEELEGDGAPSDDEAFEEARTKVEVSTEEDYATQHSGDRLLAKARSMKLPKISKRASDLARTKTNAPRELAETKADTPPKDPLAVVDETTEPATGSGTVPAEDAETASPTFLGRLLGSARL